MNRFACLAAAPAASFVTVSVRAPRAEACSPPPAVWITEPAGVPITGVPVQGVVPIFSQNELAQEDLILVTVLDASEQAVPGSVELLRYRLVWRSEAPLEPEATYRMQITDDWGQVTEVVFVTAEEGAPAPAAPSLGGAAWLGEDALPDEQLCCAGGEFDTCSGLEVEYCWTQTYVYRPRLTLSFEIDEAARRYALFDVEAGGAPVAHLLDSSDVQRVDVVYGGIQASYCATATATSLLDGSTVSAESCVDDEDRVPAEPLQAEQPDESLCGGGEDDEPWDYDDWDEGDWKTEGDGHGCSAAGGGGGLLLGLLTVLPLAAWRGRRRRGG